MGETFCFYAGTVWQGSSGGSGAGIGPREGEPAMLVVRRVQLYQFVVNLAFARALIG